LKGRQFYLQTLFIALATQPFNPQLSPGNPFMPCDLSKQSAHFIWSAKKELDTHFTS